jgi:Domain of unknown function (DUF5065)
MKKVGSMIMAGAIALGAVGTVDLVKPTQVAAATDEWGFTTLGSVSMGSTYDNMGFASTYKWGQTYSANRYLSESHVNVAMKIFKVGTDGWTLTRYKTLYPDANRNYSVTFGSTYPPGKYIAIEQIVNQIDGVSTYYLNSGQFTITQ